jgi:hypothetical protein
MQAMAIKEFQMHVDASLLNFRFIDAVYVTVRYGISVTDNYFTPIVYEIAAGPSVLKAINNMPELIRQAEAAAKNNAQFNEPSKLIA